MRGAAALLFAKNKLKSISPVERAKVGILTPKKQSNQDVGVITMEKADVIAALSKPPPLPPVVGPLVALSLLQAWSSRDHSDE
ncbi:hypothetical protein RJ639_006210 [Escallonia herrerae]|uniref:Uncharacterized protein n=1 Tax=Escallonia herrerae TaxID=1293975 RepID=A0AA88VYF4_9ASTE|nr:hypothetical protein RJ639_006210 [Escallonia herrerae]